MENLTYELGQEVDTPDGRGRVVGFPEPDSVEVRILASGLTRPWPLGELAKKQVVREKDVPTGKDGRPLKGVALRNALRTQEKLAQEQP